MIIVSHVQRLVLLVALVAAGIVSAGVERFDQDRDKEVVLQLIENNKDVFVDATADDAREGEFELAYGPNTMILHRTLYVYRHDNQTVGFISYITYLGVDLPVALIGRLAVNPAWRKHGIAQALIEQALRDMREQGKKEVMLEVVPENVAAQKLYEKLGFTKIDAAGHIFFTKSL